ncbi:hypothetical protein Tco_0540226 [Tanacetum coccineum]
MRVVRRGCERVRAAPEREIRVCERKGLEPRSAVLSGGRTGSHPYTTCVWGVFSMSSQCEGSWLKNLKLPSEGEVRLEEPASSAGTLSSIKNLDKDLSFTDQFLVEKSQEDEPKKTNTEVQEIDQKIEESVKEVVTASVQHAMRAPLRARFKDLPTSDMKEILLQRLLEENYDKGHEDHKMAYEALQKSIIRDESEKFNAYKAEERTKKKSKQDSPKTPPGSPPSPPPHLPPSSASGASGTTRASDSAKDPPPPPPSSTTNQGDQSHSFAAPGSSKTTASTAYTSWTTTTSRLTPTASSVPEDVLMHKESDFEAQDMGFDDEDSGSRHIPKTDDIGVFIDWFSKKQGITELTPEHLEGPAYEVVKAFHPDVIHLQFQMEECHKLLTNQVGEGLLRYNVSRPLPLGGPPGQGDRLALSITKMKAASYPDAGLERMVPDQIWAEEEYMYDISTSYGISHWTHMRILSVVRIEVFSLYGYDYMKKIVLRRADNQEYTIAESDFKDLYLSDFEDLYLLNLQGHLNYLPPKDKKILSTTVNLWIRSLVIRKRVEDFQLGIESYQTQLNLTKPRWEATEKSHEDEPEKTNTEAEVQSMVTVPIHQDTSSVPLMTTPVIDIIDPQSDSIMFPASMPTTTATVTETTTTTTTVPPPPPQPQQDVLTSILTQTIGQLEQNIADLVDANQALEERLDKQGNMIHQLETQDLSRLIREQTVEFIDS